MVNSTARRVPLTIGLPASMSGSITIHSRQSNVATSIPHLLYT